MKHDQLHAHKRGDASHAHAVADRKQSLLWIAMFLTLGFAFVEFFAGLISGSLALMSDAGHMVTDSAALGLAILAQYIAKRPPSAKHSFGFGRAEALAAFVNSLVMVGLVIWIAIEAVSRIQDPHPVAGMTVTIVAAIGLAVNLIVAWVLSRDQKSVNTRAALVHEMGDLLEQLDEREKKIINARFGLDGSEPITLEEVGEKFGVTRERIRQLQNIALGKMRRALAKRERMSPEMMLAHAA